jgi:uncharacterized repeat protein (TIGR01451 family)
MIQGKIKADNCGANTKGAAGSPCTFWDEAYLAGTTGYNFKVSYVTGSTRFYNNVKDFKTSGYTLSDNIVAENESGAPIGYNALDGKIQGCFQYSGYVTFLVSVQTEPATFTLTKQVRIKGDTTWNDEVTAQPGDVVQYRIVYTNVGTVAQNGIIIKDLLPTGVTYNSKSACLYNVSNNPSGSKPTDGSNGPCTGQGAWQDNDSWLTLGWNIGNYSAASNALIELEATMPGDDKLFCGNNLLQNFAIVYTPNDGNKMDNANVIIRKDCAQTCDSDGSTVLTDDDCDKPVVPVGEVERCALNPELSADDPKCVAAGDYGVGHPPLATISLILFLASASVIVGGLLWTERRRMGSRRR